MGQAASLRAAPCSQWERLLPETAALGFSPVPCAAQALAGKDSSCRQHYGGAGVCRDCLEHVLLRRHLFACSPCPVSSSLARSGERVGGWF